LDYRAGSVGRVFAVRFDHEEEILPALAGLCRREGVRAGWFFLFGALGRGRLVTGPREASLPPDPLFARVGEPHELLGMGSIAGKDGVPSLHLHASLGRGDRALTGCLRGEDAAFLVVEALVLEIAGVAASRQPDAATGLDLLRLE